MAKQPKAEKPEFDEPEAYKQLANQIFDFLEKVDEDRRAVVTEMLICETVNIGSSNYYQAVGIFEEAKCRFQKISQSQFIDDHKDTEIDVEIYPEIFTSQFGSKIVN